MSGSLSMSPAKPSTASSSASELQPDTTAMDLFDSSDVSSADESSSSVEIIVDVVEDLQYTPRTTKARRSKSFHPVSNHIPCRLAPSLSQHAFIDCLHCELGNIISFSSSPCLSLQLNLTDCLLILTVLLTAS